MEWDTCFTEWDNKKLAQNNVILDDTIHRIVPILHYNFYTKLSDFNVNNSPSKR